MSRFFFICAFGVVAGVMVGVPAALNSTSAATSCGFPAMRCHVVGRVVVVPLGPNVAMYAARYDDNINRN